jgi:dTDP-4-amino-4,6-dideoxygalactose transaminase
MTKTTAHGGPIPYWKTLLDEREANAAADAIRAGYLSAGETLEQFERELERTLGVAHVACTLNGTLAIYLALAAGGIRPGDEVIIPNRTFIAAAHAVLMTGATPALVDVVPDRPLIDVEAFAAAITPRTRAVIPTHLNGRAVEMDRLNAIAREHDILVVEDTAQGFGASLGGRALGTIGDIGCFSLGVTKLITTGQGGFVATNDDERYERVLRFRNQGVPSTFSAAYEVPGCNLKFNGILAAVGLAQLTRIDEKKRHHAGLYAAYRAGLAGVPGIEILENRVDRGELPLWVEALVPDRPAFIEGMGARGIQVRPFLPDLAESAWLGRRPDEFRASLRFAREGVFLPCGPATTLETAAHVCREIANLYAR